MEQRRDLHRVFLGYLPNDYGRPCIEVLGLTYLVGVGNAQAFSQRRTAEARSRMVAQVSVVQAGIRP